MQFEISKNSVNMISSDAAIVFAFEEKNKKNTSFEPLASFIAVDTALKGQLTKIAALEKFKGKKGEVITVIPSEKCLTQRVIIVGLGKKEEFVLDGLRRAVGSVTKRLKKKLETVSLSIPDDLLAGSDLSATTQTVVEGFILGGYNFVKYKKKEENEKQLATIIVSVENSAHKKQIEVGIRKAQLYGKATCLARDLINEQGSVATPTFLAEVAEDIGKSNNHITCKIFDKPALEKMGMGAFLSIARGADTSPKFIFLSYVPEKPTKKKKKLAIVGKGITFDSGGVSLKPAQYMMDMKSDMSGAAVVLAVFSIIAEIKPDFPIMGLVAATPNLVSGSAVVPGDVSRAMNGKTIEILNTDAEGRVTMADSISFAIEQGATEIIDLATLTGACQYALGLDIAGLFSNNVPFAEQVKTAAYEAGEKMWELPLEKEYKELNKSDVADIANIASIPYGGAITAALFLEEFVDNKPWVHLDIAGPAFIEKPSDISTKGGTGFGVRTILNLISQM